MGGRKRFAYQVEIVCEDRRSETVELRTYWCVEQHNYVTEQDIAIAAAAAHSILKDGKKAKWAPTGIKFLGRMP